MNRNRKKGINVPKSFIDDRLPRYVILVFLRNKFLSNLAHVALGLLVSIFETRTYVLYKHALEHPSQKANLEFI